MLNKSWIGVIAFAAMTVAHAAVAAGQDIVLHSSDVSAVQGNWAVEASASGAGGQRMTSADYGWSSADAPLASPRDYFEATFSAPSYTTYHVWLRLRAGGESKWNDSVWVQFSDAIDTNGSAAYRVGTTSALLMNLEPCSGCGVSSWGWKDGGYWLSQSPLIMFGASGSHTIRVQTREDGVQVDQIVLSPATYLSRAPGQQSNDTVILPRATDGGSAAAVVSTASWDGNISYNGGPLSIPGTIWAHDFDNGGEGVSYHDTSGGNNGGVYRNTGVDLEPSVDGGNNIGWVEGGEWVNYTVNVESSGNYRVQLRVASPSGGGSMHVGFNQSNVWSVVPVRATGSWQAYTTLELPVTLNAGTQILTVLFDTGGMNLSKIMVSSGGSGSGAAAPAPPAPAPAYSAGGTFRMMTWNIQHGRTRSGSYDLASQAQFIASQNADVVALQEVETWDEDQPQRYRQLLEQYTGQGWSVVWAPVMNSASTEGNVILTRLPVVSQNTYQMHASGNWFEMYANRSAAHATVRVGGVDVNVFSTHLDYYSTTYRSTQLHQLMSWAGNFGGPRLVGGDFNSWWGEYWITTMMSQYTDSWQDYTGSNQNGYTINNAVRFDYIFRSMDGGWRATPVNCWVPSTSLSDHNPVVAEYRVQ